jgi:hypothetical protein
VAREKIIKWFKALCHCARCNEPMYQHVQVLGTENNAKIIMSGKQNRNMDVRTRCQTCGFTVATLMARKFIQRNSSG